MIKKESFTAALGLSSTLADNNKSIIALPNTLLSHLVSVSVPPEYVFSDRLKETWHQYDGEDSVEGYGYRLEDFTSGQDNIHTLTINKVIEEISEAVTSHISFAKNQVKPHVIDLGDKLKDFLETHTDKDPSTLFELSVMSTPEVLKENAFLDLLKVYEGKSPVTPDYHFSLGSRSEDEIKPLIQTGFDYIDKLIDSWLSTLPNGFIVDIWTEYFDGKGENKYRAYETIKHPNPFIALNASLLVFIISNKLYNEVGEEVKTTLRQHQLTSIQHKEFGGVSILSSLNKINAFNKSGILVIEKNYYDKTVYVNGDIYSEWLNNGGSPETLLGMIVGGSDLTNADLIRNKRTDLESEWNTYCLFEKSKNGNILFQSFKEELLLQFSLSMSVENLDAEEKDYSLRHPEFKQIVSKLVKEIISNIKPDDLKTPYKIALELVGKARYYYTGSYNILKDMEEAMELNPKLNPREAATLAIVYYVTDFLLSQTKVV